MKKDDVKRLFNLLETLYPREKKRPRDNATLAAWALVLEPYGYEDVKAAAVVRARENGFFPDASELARYIPGGAAGTAGGRKPGEFIDKRLEEAREHWNQLVPQRREVGLPATVTEAKAAGMTAGAWLELLDAHGLGLA